ncbi:exopolysaccharide biosynthesis protein [Henriciella mobilis]|uniref:exopolysaccharide biosynthesis protein n=1 Tax=Henriciella mobilis TaxID=2305467 RepID=UPI000E667010|nr:exopolysaccharide biosynthesis protein [Henriciella mobilis]RIJ17455.1 exopolysaccharide biosynthesis protein [Henriciella mobilis]RIJ25558.1 exopolysaccharide biosynthesis protein [Henriciella mobilis]
MTRYPSPRTFLQSIELMAEEAPEEGFSLRMIFDRLDERAFGAALFILALPCCIPFLYGVPQVVSLPMMVLAGQMVAGREEPWLPQKFGQRMIDKKGLTRTAKGGRKWFGWLEKIARPRLTFLMGARGERIIGLFLVFFCASILVPLPSTNTVPGFGVAIVAFGLMARDGILVIIGSIIGTAWIATLLTLVALGVRTLTGS